MPLYTHLYNLMADSFIGVNRLPRENHYTLTGNYQILMIFDLRQPFFCWLPITLSLSPLDGTNRVIFRAIMGYATTVENLKKYHSYFPCNNWLSHGCQEFGQNKKIKKCCMVLFQPIALICNKWDIIPSIKASFSLTISFIVPSVSCDFEDDSNFLCGYINRTYDTMTSSHMWIPIPYESDNDAAKASSDTGKLPKIHFWFDFKSDVLYFLHKTLCAGITALFGYPWFLFDIRNTWVAILLQIRNNKNKNYYITIQLLKEPWKECTWL